MIGISHRGESSGRADGNIGDMPINRRCEKVKRENETVSDDDEDFDGDIHIFIL